MAHKVEDHIDSNGNDIFFVVVIHLFITSSAVDWEFFKESGVERSLRFLDIYPFRTVLKYMYKAEI